MRGDEQRAGGERALEQLRGDERAGLEPEVGRVEQERVGLPLEQVGRVVGDRRPRRRLERLRRHLELAAGEQHGDDAVRAHVQRQRRLVALRELRREPLRVERRRLAQAAPARVAQPDLLEQRDPAREQLAALAVHVGRRRAAVALELERVQPLRDAVELELALAALAAPRDGDAERARERARLHELDEPGARRARAARLGEVDRGVEQRQLGLEVGAVEAVAERRLAERVDDRGGVGERGERVVRAVERRERASALPVAASRRGPRRGSRRGRRSRRRRAPAPASGAPSPSRTSTCRLRRPIRCARSRPASNAGSIFVSRACASSKRPRAASIADQLVLDARRLAERLVGVEHLREQPLGRVELAQRLAHARLVLDELDRDPPERRRLVGAAGRAATAERSTTSRARARRRCPACRAFARRAAAQRARRPPGSRCSARSWSPSHSSTAASSSAVCAACSTSPRSANSRRTSASCVSASLKRPSSASSVPRSRISRPNGPGLRCACATASAPSRSASASSGRPSASTRSASIIVCCTSGCAISSRSHCIGASPVSLWRRSSSSSSVAASRYARWAATRAAVSGGGDSTATSACWERPNVSAIAANSASADGWVIPRRRYPARRVAVNRAHYAQERWRWSATSSPGTSCSPPVARTSGS